MRKKSRLFLSMASMVLTVALFCFGVYAALGVSYTISGSVVYQVKDVFVNIQTSLYMSKDTSLTDQETLDGNVALFETNPQTAQTTTNTEKLSYSDGLSTYNPDTGVITNSGEAVSKTSANIPINYGSYEAGAKGFAYYIVVSITNYGTESVSVTLTNNINNEQTNSLTKLSENTTIEGRTADKTYTTEHIVIGMALNDATKSVSNVSFNVPILIERDAPLQATPEKYTIDEQAKTITINADATGDVVIGKGDETVTGLTLSSQSSNITSVYALSDCGDPTGQNHFITGLTSDAFCESTNLQKVDLSNCLGITEIPDGKTGGGDAWSESGTFYACNSLIKIKLPTSLTSIGKCAFAKCSIITEIAIPDDVHSIGKFAFDKCQFTTVNYITDGDGYSFENGTLTITKARTTEGWQTDIAKWYSANLNPLITNVVWKCSPTLLWDNTFTECSSLTEITIPDGLQSIKGQAFEFCSSLSQIIIPDSVQGIGFFAFEFCSSLQAVYVEATTPPTLGTSVFDYCHANLKIYVPAGCGETYKTATGWSYYADKIVEMAN